MVLSRSVFGALAALATTAAACSGAATVADGGRPTVVATTSIWADIASHVLCEEVPALIPAGADPHTFEPSLRDRELVEGARVVITNGAGLESNLADLLNAAPTVVDVSRRVDVVAGDPHFWQDIRRVGLAIAAIESSVDTTGTCADDYLEQLDRLDRDIIEMFALIPDDARVMVTSHDSLAYFGARYGIEIVGTVIPSTNTMAQTNAADLAELADVIEQRGVRVIFTEQLESTADADALARRLGVDVIPLVTDALTADPATDTYLEMMQHNAAEIARALAP